MEFLGCGRCHRHRCGYRRGRRRGYRHRHRQSVIIALLAKTMQFTIYPEHWGVGCTAYSKHLECL